MVEFIAKRSDELRCAYWWFSFSSASVAWHGCTATSMAYVKYALYWNGFIVTGLWILLWNATINNQRKKSRESIDIYLFSFFHGSGQKAICRWDHLCHIFMYKINAGFDDVCNDPWSYLHFTLFFHFLYGTGLVWVLTQYQRALFNAPSLSLMFILRINIQACTEYIYNIYIYMSCHHQMERERIEDREQQHTKKNTHTQTLEISFHSTRR